MNSTAFQPKVFYRKLDSLLIRIGRSAGAKEVMTLVLGELVGSFGPDLGIRSGTIYELRKALFHLIEGPVGGDRDPWPKKIPSADASVELLHRHKNYIFSNTAVPPWGNNSVAVLVGEEDQYLMVFRLAEGWVRETLEFSLNTIRSTVNYSRYTRRLRADFQEASEIQTSLLPEIDPVFEGYDIAGRFLPAERVGGDLYDYHVLGEDCFGIAVGDASGHGLPAALLARDVVTGLRMGIEKEMKITSVFDRLNRVINRSRLSTRFVSLFYGELEQDGMIVYINAGHPPPLLFKGDRVERLTVGGTILGPLESTVFKRGFAFIDPGEVLVLFTDGVFEIAGQDGDMFGIERLTDLIRQVKHESAQMMIDRLFERLAEFGKSDRLQDDATTVIVKRIS
jgi:sigma-B regulation protein RsbU (phosphoserine phosphatase)